jgi:hypothetical protein
MPQPIRLFYSYSHKDEDLRDELEKHLTILKRNSYVQNWHDRRINPGNDWDKDINQNLLEADIILFLVSVDFISSDYCNSVEVKKAMERHEKGEAKCIPIFLRPCNFSSAPFAKLQGLPRDAKFITSREYWQDLDTAFTSVSKELEEEIRKIWKKKEENTLAVAQSSSNQLKEPQTKTQSIYSLIPKVTNNFTGRVRELALLNEKFKNGNIICIEGIGGVGKSELVIKFLEKFDNNNTVWFDCKIDSSFESLVEYAGYFDLLKVEKNEKLATYLGFKDLIERDKKIIILDNYQYLRDGSFQDFFKSLKNSLRSSKFILLTRERITIESIDIVHFQINGLADDSIEFSKKIIQNNYNNSISIPDDKLIKICDQLSGHPFAIQLAIQLLFYEGNSDNILLIIKEYANEREKLSKRLLDEVFNHPNASQEEKSLLLNLSVFRGRIERNSLQYIAHFNYKNALRNLIDKLMVSQSGGLYQLHPLVREFAYLKLENKKAIHSLVLNYYVEKATNDNDLSIQEEIFYHIINSEKIEFGVQYFEQNSEKLISCGHHNFTRTSIEYLNEKGYNSQKLVIILTDICYILSEPPNTILDRIKIAFNLPIQSEEILLEAKITEREILLSLGDLEDPITKFKELLFECDKINFQKGKLICLGNIGSYYSERDEFNLAENYLTEALKMHENLNYYAGSQLILNSVAYLNYRKGRYNQAYKFYSELLNKAEGINNIIGINMAKNGLAMIHSSKGEFNQALEIYTTCLEKSKEIGDKKNQTVLLHNIASTLRDKGNSSFIRYLDECIEMAAELKDYIRLSFCSELYGIHFFSIFDYVNSVSSLLKAIACANKMKVKRDSILQNLLNVKNKIGRSDYLLLLKECYENLEDNLKAYINLTEIKFEPIIIEKKPGRNDPCPCGSGKKYKNCHGKEH